MKTVIQTEVDALALKHT